MYPSVLAMIGEFASPGHGDEHASSPSFISSASPFQARYVELYGRVKTRDFGEMLSFPTHSKGWIDPRVFVDRLQRRTQSDRPLGRLDFICALLRLAADFRAESLQKVEQLKEPYRRIVRFALGAAEYPTEADNDHVTEWLAAGRSRDPMGRLSELEALQSEMIRDDEPNNIRPAEFTWQPDQAARTIGRKRDAFAGYLIPWLNARGVVSFEPDAINRTDMVERPTVALIMTLLVSTVRLTYVDWVQLLAASHWPGNPETTMAVACRMLTVHLNDDVVTHAPLNAVMDPLLRVDQRWSDLVYVAICLGLVSKNSQTTGGAVDALIDGITDGRADALRLGATLVHVASGGWMKLNRLTDALREVVRTSVLAERVVGEILDRLIASWESLPRDGHHVLSLQVELLASLEHELSPQAREVLSGVKGSGKAVKLAKQLCAMQSSPASVPMKQAAIEAAEGRLARAERIDRYLRQAQRASSD